MDARLAYNVRSLEDDARCIDLHLKLQNTHHRTTADPFGYG